MLYEFEGKKPVIGEGSYICPSATIIGDVRLGKNCYVGPGARLRGDYGTIVIGDYTAVEDNVVIHARPGEKIHIGEHVTIGHASILHNCKVMDWVVIGMGAIVSDYAVVGKWAAIGEGAVVKNRQEIPERAIVVGVPAKVIGETSEEYRKQWREFKRIYSELAATRYPSSLIEIRREDNGG